LHCFMWLKLAYLFVNLFIHSLFVVVYLRQDLCVAQGGLKLQSSCLSLSNAGFSGMSHLVWLVTNTLILVLYD
jgi:hypothetical protein